MKTFIYIIAMVDPYLIEEGPAAIRFGHLELLAEDEDAAYLLGQRLVNDAALQMQAELQVQNFEIANDYVVEVGA